MINHPMTNYDLLYDIAGRSLSGAFDGTPFLIQAVGAGGRAGSKRSKEDYTLANNFTKTGKSMGPLPACRYRMTAHRATRQQVVMTCIWLDPITENTVAATPEGWHSETVPAHMLGRSGMLIHGEGPEGSVGCIVLHRNDLLWLWGEIEKNPGLVLQVVGARGGFDPQSGYLPA